MSEKWADSLVEASSTVQMESNYDGPAGVVRHVQTGPTSLNIDPRTAKERSRQHVRQDLMENINGFLASCPDWQHAYNMNLCNAKEMTLAADIAAPCSGQFPSRKYSASRKYAYE